jgi:hypothetical protein
MEKKQTHAKGMKDDDKTKIQALGWMPIGRSQLTLFHKPSKTTLPMMQAL